MGLRNFTFINPANIEEFVKTKPISDEQQSIIQKNADQICFQLLNSFISIEDYLTRFILEALGVPQGNQVDIEKLKSYNQRFAKIFSAKDRQDIMQSLLKEDIIIDNKKTDIELPTDFKKIKTLDYWKALQLGFEYRNNLAHNGYRTLVGKIKGKYIMQPTIMATKSQIERGYPNINILRRSEIDSETKKRTYLSFLDFTGNLFYELRGPFGSRFIVNPTQRGSEFLVKRKNRLESIMKSFLKSKEKKLDRFIIEFQTDFEKKDCD